MATKYVDSNATGLNDGSSAANAWTDVASSSGVAAGDEVRISKLHAQSGASLTVNWSNGTIANPVKLLTVDFSSSDALATGASITTTGNMALTGHVYANGMTWNCGGQLFLEWSPGKSWFQENGGFVLTGNSDPNFFGGGPAFTMISLLNATLNMSGMGSTARKVSFQQSGLFRMIGGSLVNKTSQITAFWDGNFPVQMEFEGVDLGTFTNLLENSSRVEVVVRRCKGSITNWFSTAVTQQGSYYLIERSVSGTLTVDSLGLTKFGGWAGTITSDLTRYRSGGANDGVQANAYSWAMTTNGSALPLYVPLRSPPITVWVPAGSQTITVYVASGVTLNNDEFWVEVESPSEAGSATAQAKYNTTRCAPRSTPAALAPDGTSTWTGSGVGTKQKVTVTINPTIAGPVSLRIFAAKVSTAGYVDPKLEVA